MTYLGESMPKLGFGMMRLPKLEDGSIDIAQTEQMVDAFLEAGLTYFDTARAYGESEDAVRRALVERHPRDSFTLATKVAPWLGSKNAEEAKALFDTSLEKTGAGYFDYYLLHNLGGARTEFFDRFGLWDWARDLREQGKIKHLGFSMHDNAEALARVLEIHRDDVEFVQLQVNYADWEDKAVQSRACLEVARRFELPVVIMEPVRGGTLAAPPRSVADILAEADPDQSPVSWALRFVWGLEGVLTVLSGMSTLEQMRQNIESYRTFMPLSAAEHEVIVRAQEALALDRSIPCTTCRYCVDGCPAEIDIPSVLEALNKEQAFPGTGRGSYNFSTRTSAKASECVQCGQCEDACPQHIPIIEHLERASELFES